jgi:UDP-glucose 4-epimerase
MEPAARHAARRARFANVYGPRQEAGLEGGVVAIFLDAMAAGAQTTIYGDGRQTRDFVHVDDVVRALLLAPGSGRVFNVGSGAETSVLDLHEHCRAVSGGGQEAAFAPAREGDVQRSALDVSLVERELGWRPQVALDDGLRKTWEWAQSKT